MDEKYNRRFTSFCNSLDALSEAKNRDFSDSFVLSGTSAKFSITFDLAWKVMKDILVKQLGITDFAIGSPRAVLQAAFTNGLIRDDVWMKMLKTRNLLAHDYDGTIAERKFDIIISGYYDAFTEFKNTVTKYYDGSQPSIDDF